MRFRQMGQLFMMGFDGTTVDQQIRSLIEDYHVGNILLNAKNLKCKPGQSIYRSIADTVQQQPPKKPLGSS